MAHVVPHKKFEDILAAIKADKKLTTKQDALSFYEDRACLVSFKPAKSLKGDVLKSLVVEIISKIIPAKAFTVELTETESDCIANIKLVATLEEEVMFE